MTSSEESAERRAEDLDVEVRTTLPIELLTMIDAWRERHQGKPSRNEAVRQLLINHFWPPVLGVEKTFDE